MWKIHKKIEDGLKIYDRIIYKKKGNEKIISEMIRNENLTVNQIVERIAMTRQGVRNHIFKLERKGEIFIKGLIGRNNIVYVTGGER